MLWLSNAWFLRGTAALVWKVKNAAGYVLIKVLFLDESGDESAATLNSLSHRRPIVTSPYRWRREDYGSILARREAKGLPLSS